MAVTVTMTTLTVAYHWVCVIRLVDVNAPVAAMTVMRTTHRLARRVGITDVTAAMVDVAAMCAMRHWTRRMILVTMIA